MRLVVYFLLSGFLDRSCAYLNVVAEGIDNITKILAILLFQIFLLAMLLTIRKIRYTNNNRVPNLSLTL